MIPLTSYSLTFYYHVVSRWRFMLPLLLVIVAQISAGGAAQAQDPTPYPDNFKVKVTDITHNSANVDWGAFTDYLRQQGFNPQWVRNSDFVSDDGHRVERNYAIPAPAKWRVRYLWGWGREKKNWQRRVFQPNTRYSFTLEIVDEDFKNPHAVDVQFTTMAAPSSGSAPTVNIFGITTNTADISWSAAAASNVRYNIYVNWSYRMQVGNAAPNNGIWLTQLLPGSVNVIAIEQVTVRTNSYGHILETPVNYFTVNVQTKKEATVNSLQISNITADSALLSWVDPNSFRSRRYFDYTVISLDGHIGSVSISVEIQMSRYGLSTRATVAIKPALE